MSSSGIPLPLLLFGVTFVVEALGWIGNDSIASFFYAISLFFSSTPHAKQQRVLKTQVLSLRAELKATSAQDEFSKWAKLRRKVDKAVADLEALNGQAAGSKAAFASWFKRMLWILTTVLPFIISSWHRKEAVFYLPKGWFGPLGWWMGLPSAPAGGIACGIWTMACKKTLGAVHDIVVDLAGAGKVPPPPTQQPGMEVPVNAEKPSAGGPAKDEFSTSPSQLENTSELDGLDEIADELTRNRIGNIFSITSIRYNKPKDQLRVVVSAIKALPSLRRLHLAGTGPDEGLFVPQHDLLGKWTSLEVLQLDFVDLSSKEDLESWVPNVTSMGLFGCRGAATLFFSPEKEGFSRNRIQHLNISTPTTTSGERSNTSAAVLSLVACSHARSLTFNLDVTAAIGGLVTFLEDKILNWVASDPLTTLSLSVFGPFYANDVLASLSLPHVQTLVLDVDSASIITLDGDMISWADTSNYTQVVRFLTLASLPSLTTLHLRGWLEKTGSSNLANVPLHALSTKAPLIYLLLGVLRTTTVVELRLENSSGHAERNVQCIFKREGDGEWSARLVKFW
ncbi:hypothetical protein RQP46_001608 [Phenoliferia psychrophenolica]